MTPPEPRGGEVERIAREAIEFIRDLDNALTEDRVVAGAAKKVSVRLLSRLQAAISPSSPPSGGGGIVSGDCAQERSVPTSGTEQPVTHGEVGP